MNEKILITGAGGFVASTFVRRALQTTNYKIRAFARNTNNNRLHHRLLSFTHVQDAIKSGRLEIVFGDLLGDVSELCEGVDYVIHAAAKTHVDTSIKSPLPFIESNILGTYAIIENARKYGIKKYIQVSTDEVYSSISEGAYTEDAPLLPANPYSSSKASGDCLAICYTKTYGLNTIITRTENNFGFFQHPQKVVPVFVNHAVNNLPLPVYGNGKNVRMWLWVEDHVDALIFLLENNTTLPGSIWHIAGNQELENLELAKKILKILNKPNNLIKFIDEEKVRKGHDFRYALNSNKIRKLGWSPKVSLDEGIAKAVKWYSENTWWSA